MKTFLIWVVVIGGIIWAMSWTYQKTDQDKNVERLLDDRNDWKWYALRMKLCQKSLEKYSLEIPDSNLLLRGAVKESSEAYDKLLSEFSLYMNRFVSEGYYFDRYVEDLDDYIKEKSIPEAAETYMMGQCVTFLPYFMGVKSEPPESSFGEGQY